MRKLHTFDAFELAERLADYLVTREAAAEVRSESGGGFAVWVLDDDRLSFAKGELAEFSADPAAERFRTARRPPQSGPTAEAPERANRPTAAWQKMPVTIALVVASVVATAVTLYGKELGLGDLGERARPALRIVDDHHQTDLAEVRSGEVWRLVAPIFPHGDPLHLLFNMAWLWLLGGAIETMRGSLRMAALVLATAVVSNVAEYYLDVGFTFDQQNGLVNQSGFMRNPFFLGMSGVVFGLFGYIWMQARLLPKSGFAMPGDMVVWMMIWLVVCTSGVVGPIANVAHGAGLLSGMFLGAVPRLWTR